MTNTLQGKTILVTGAGRGIGRATALLLAKNNAKVAINYLNNKEQAERVVAEIKAMGGEAGAFGADVTREAEVAAMIEGVKNNFGKIDVLINNATAPIAYKSFNELGWDEFEKHLNVQIRGVYNTVKAVLPSMMENRNGNIINVVTTATLGVPPARMSGYTTAKYGLIGFTKTLATELGKFSIRVNAISPGFTETDLTSAWPPKAKELFAAETPLGRNTTSEDVARAILFLASHDSSHITGANIPVCGGSDM
jgi:3-oxoacyl-[acyl-carrier protein] reductase